MAFGTHEDADDVMNEINMTPLVDVMLVLLIVFIITIPVMKHAVNIDLPRAASQAVEAKPQTIRLSVDAQGRYYWNEARLVDDELESKLRTEAARTPQPQLHIRGDKAVRYERVASAMAAAQRAGLRRIGFITEPGALSAHDGEGAAR
jgi:biopolymer transport protein ExbD